MDSELIPWEVHCALKDSAVDSFSAVLQRELAHFRTKTRANAIESSIASELKANSMRVQSPLEHNTRVEEKSQLGRDVVSISADELFVAVEQDSEVIHLLDVLAGLRAQVTECETFLEAQTLHTGPRHNARRDQFARQQLDSDLGRRQSVAQRKATIAAFRKASAAIITRPSLAGAVEPSRAPVNDKPTQSLTAATAESYFSLEKRDDIVRDLSELGRSGNDNETVVRLQVAAAGERLLFEETIAAMTAVHEQDRADIDNALVRQRMRLQAAESHVSKLVAAELQRLVASQRQGPSDAAVPVREDDDSDTASSDSDVLESRDIELTRMIDGTIRVSVGLQSEIASLSDLDLGLVATVLKESRAREVQIRESLESMSTILRNLERCNEAFEADFFCSSCRASFVDLYLLWPCGHQYCLDCVYRNELQAGGYFCEECQSATTEIPVPNVAVNDVVSRMSFKRSGVHGLFDVINRFRKETFNAESTEKGFTAGLHVGLPQL